MTPGAGRVRIKICGITREEDALAAIALGADALGFNLFPGSKRHVELRKIEGWVRRLPPFVARVAVLVNAPLPEALEISAHPAIDLIQLHGDEDAAYCASLKEAGRPFIKAVRVKDASSLAGLEEFSTRDLLLDAHSGQGYGGTGTALDPELVAEAVRRHPGLRVIFAGGLRPENVLSAVRVAHPYAVDVASGVESSPGIKDLQKMAAFIAAVESLRP